MSNFDYILITTLGQGYLLAFFLLTSKYYRSTANTWLSAATVLLATIGILDIVGKSYITKSVLVKFLINDLPLNFYYIYPFIFISMSLPQIQRRKTTSISSCLYPF